MQSKYETIEQLNNEEATDDDIRVLLECLGVPRETEMKANKDTLNILTEKFHYQLVYHNVGLHLKVKKIYSLKFRDLLERIIVRKLGGLCYELGIIVYYTLKYFGFDVHFIEVTTQFDVKQPYWKYQLRDHNLLLVKNCEGIDYFVEVMVSFRSIKQPIPVDLSIEGS
jgi:arylamine N-acetyltransferase